MREEWALKRMRATSADVTVLQQLSFLSKTVAAAPFSTSVYLLLRRKHGELLASMARRIAAGPIPPSDPKPPASAPVSTAPARPSRTGPVRAYLFGKKK